MRRIKIETNRRDHVRVSVAYHWDDEDGEDGIWKLTVGGQDTIALTPVQMKALVKIVTEWDVPKRGWIRWTAEPVMTSGPEEAEEGGRG